MKCHACEVEEAKARMSWESGEWFNLCDGCVVKAKIWLAGRYYTLRPIRAVLPVDKFEEGLLGKLTDWKMAKQVGAEESYCISLSSKGKVQMTKANGGLYFRRVEK